MVVGCHATVTSQRPNTHLLAQTGTDRARLGDAIIKAAAPRTDPVVKNILYVIGGLILAGVAFNVLSSQGLINGVGRSGSAAPGFQVTGTIQTHQENTSSGQKTNFRDLSGTLTNNTGNSCSRTEIVATMLDDAGAVVTVAVAAHVAANSGQTVSWKTSRPYDAETNTITHARWAALCTDSP